MALPPTMLHMLCGKIASGKSTLAAHLSSAKGTVLISEDDWLKALFFDQLSSGSDYVRCSSRLRSIMAPHVGGLLGAEVSVVLDFPANTIDQRSWMRNVVEDTGAEHQLHFLDVPDDLCLTRLRQRNDQGDHAFAATEAQFREFSKHFVAPTSDEGFNVVVHRET